MLTVTRDLTTEALRNSFAAECEAAFESRLDVLCAELRADRGLKIIALSGPTCSGKTTTARRIIGELEGIGRDVHLVSIDDFFKERDVLNRAAEMSENATLDYDSVSAIDLDLLASCAETIIKGEPTELPAYDFVTGKRTLRESFDPDDDSIYIFEGIQAVYPEVTALFGESYTSVGINVAEDLELNGIYFGKRDIRLMRRLVRDYKFRGAEPEFTFYLWGSVAANEKKSIEPYEHTLKHKISSIMPYEFMLYRDELREILARVPDESRFLAKALEITRKLESFEQLDRSILPVESLMHEFIG